MAKHLSKRHVEAIVNVLNGWPAGHTAHLERPDQARLATPVDRAKQADAGSAGVRSRSRSTSEKPSCAEENWTAAIAACSDNGSNG